MFKRLLKRLSLLVILMSLGLALSSCKIDGEEQVEIHADGALTLRANYQFPELGLSLREGAALVDYLNGLAERHEIISIRELSCERAGNATVRLIAEIHVSDGLKLREIAESELKLLENENWLDHQLLAKLKAVVGSSSIEMAGLNLKFKRTIEFGDFIKQEVPQLNRDLLGNFQFRYSITSPSSSAENNADHISNNGKTLTWVMPLRDHIEQPFIMQATLPIPIPWWAWLLAALAIMLICYLVWKILRFVFKRKR